MTDEELLQDERHGHADLASSSLNLAEIFSVSHSSSSGSKAKQRAKPLWPRIDDEWGKVGVVKYTAMLVL